MYQITIKKITPETRVRKEYQQIADSGNSKDGGAVYDYVTCEVTEDKEITILEQKVDDFDLKLVIRAINKL